MRRSTVLFLVILCGSTSFGTSLKKANDLLSAKHYADAKEAFSALVANDPANGEAWFGLGTALVQSGDEATAIGPLQKAIALHVRVNPAALLIARIYAHMGKRDEALAAIRAIVPPAPAVFAAIQQSADFAELRKYSEFMSAAAALKPCSSLQFGSSTSGPANGT
jgi:tetratricopeptide (TPR) repeat protein